MALTEAECEDARIDYIATLTPLVLGIDKGLWDDLIWKEDNQLALKDFLDTPSTKHLFIFLNDHGQLVIKLEMPPSSVMPKKCIYFQKYDDVTVPIPMSDFKSCFMCGMLNQHPLKQFESIYKDVMLPIICNPRHISKWPKNIADDIVTHFEDFYKSLVYCHGQAEGKVTLPMPEDAKLIETIIIDSLEDDCSLKDTQLQTILDAIGAMVVDWTFWISEILEENLSQSEAIESDTTLMAEIIYWEDRMHSLELVSAQMNNPLVIKMLLALEKTKSCYHEVLVKLFVDVAEALKEASDIAEHFITLKEHISKIDNSSIEELQSVLPEAMTAITNTWMESMFFSTFPSRIAMLVQKICSVLIKRVHCIDSKHLFKNVRSLSKEKVKLSSDVLEIFLDSYNKCRNFTEILGAPEVVAPFIGAYPWAFPDNRVFNHLESFIKRLKKIQDLFGIADTYHLIPVITLVTLQQTALKLRLKATFEEFCKQYKVFEESKYDPLDLQNKLFEDHYNSFIMKIRDIDQQLGAAIGDSCVKSVLCNQSFELMGQLKDLLARPQVEVEFKNCVRDLVLKVNFELQLAKVLYEEQVHFMSDKENYVVHKGMPRIASALLWSSELKKSIISSVESLNALEKYYVVNKDTESIEQAHKELVENLDKYEKTMIGKWAENINELATEKMDKKILVKDEQNLFILNYDLQTSEIMLEVKMLRKMKIKEIPPEARLLLAKEEDVHYARSALISTIAWYNKLTNDLMDVEKALITAHWKEIEELLVEFENRTWRGFGIKDYAEVVYNKTKTVYDSTQKSKENIDEIKKMIEIWSTKPMYVRPFPNGSVDFRIYMTPAVRERYNAIIETGNKMIKVMEENLKLYKCDEASPEWKDYVLYLESIFEDGLCKAVRCSFTYLLENTDAFNENLAPFIVVQLKLEDTFVFVPPIDLKSSQSLINCFDAVMDKIYGMGVQIKRLSNWKENYEGALSKSDDLTHLRNSIVQNVIRASHEAHDCIDNFSPYSDFWIVDIKECLEDFLIFGPPQEREEEGMEEKFEETATEMQLTPPTEEDFQSQISQFELLYRKAEAISSNFAAELWLEVDANSFKTSLLACIKLWVTTYKQKLIELKSLGKLHKVEKDEG